MKPQQDLSERYQRRAIDVTLAVKLTLTYGKYHLAMLHRQLAMSEERTTYQQADNSEGTIASMRKVVEAYKKTMLEMLY